MHYKLNNAEEKNFEKQYSNKNLTIFQRKQNQPDTSRNILVLDVEKGPFFFLS